METMTAEKSLVLNDPATPARKQREPNIGFQRAKATNKRLTDKVMELPCKQLKANVMCGS